MKDNVYWDAIGTLRAVRAALIGRDSKKALELCEMFWGLHNPAKACLNCEVTIVTGTGTGRRSHAKYCSDRCRVAAMRKRQG